MSVIMHYACEQCGMEYDPIASRWLCTNCHWKSSCCEGQPLAPTVNLLHLKDRETQ